VPSVERFASAATHKWETCAVLDRCRMCDAKRWYLSSHDDVDSCRIVMSCSRRILSRVTPMWAPADLARRSRHRRDMGMVMVMLLLGMSPCAVRVEGKIPMLILSAPNPDTSFESMRARL